MAKITLRQGAVTAKLSQVEYHGVKGFQADNNWYVREESLDAVADTLLVDGPAAIQHGRAKYEVNIIVFEFERQPGEEADDDDAVCPIEIEYEGGLQKLALALGLLDHLSPRQRRAILGN